MGHHRVLPDAPGARGVRLDRISPVNPGGYRAGRCGAVRNQSLRVAPGRECRAISLALGSLGSDAMLL